MASAVASARKFLAASCGVTPMEFGIIVAAIGAAIALGSAVIGPALSSSSELIAEAMSLGGKGP
jgi:Flp pilus assembly pilin Flp